MPRPIKYLPSPHFGGRLGGGPTVPRLVRMTIHMPAAAMALPLTWLRCMMRRVF